MMRLVIASLLVVHGLITASQSTGCFQGSPGVPNPGWLSWWPTSLGTSWLVAPTNALATIIFGTLWLLAGLGFVAAGLALLGVFLPSGWWVGLAAISLVVLALYLHPLYGLAIVVDAGILIALLWARWPMGEVSGL